MSSPVVALPPLMVATPLLAGGALAAAGRRLARPVLDTASLLVCLLVLGGVTALLLVSGTERVVSWIGGYTPEHGASVGIVFVVDRMGAGLATAVATLVTAALIYTWRYFDEVESYFHVLILLFLAGMVGFTLTGDLFNAFVFFELMGVVAYALTGYKVEEARPLQGALNFAVINSLGAYCSLLGIGLIYGRTGELGLAQIQRALAGQYTDWLVIVAATLVLTGFLVKAAAVPFHFWLADAHAVAPSPVCLLFSGVMVELGVYGVARIWSAALSPALPAERIRPVLMTLGVVTALVGSVMCLAQPHLKRLLAFSTVGHVGVFLVVLGGLEPVTLGGLGLYVLGHAAVKGALFLCAGILLNVRGSVDVTELYGRGRDLPVTRICFFAAALALAGLPPFGMWLGKSVAEDGLTHAGYTWTLALFVTVSTLTGGAVLRAGLRVFLGAGTPPATTRRESPDERPETEQALRTAPATMLAPVIALVVGALALGLAPGLPAAAEEAGRQLLDATGYASAALDTANTAPTALLAATSSPGAAGIALGGLSTLVALAVATTAVYADRLPRLLRRAGHALTPPLHVLRVAHSGHLGDYVAWLLLGIALLSIGLAVS